MTLTSIYFPIFLIATFIIYFTAPKRFQWIVLLISSYIFYASSGIKLIVFLLFTTMTTYFAAIYIHKANKLKRNKLKKRIVTVTLLLNFGMLAFLKYYNFTIDGINPILTNITNVGLPRFNILLPLGISFYIFQSIGYVLDVNRNRYEPERNIAKFALFVSFFPQMIQGPISRYDQLAPQLYKSHTLDLDRFKYGIQLMMWGYLKKVIIADRAVILVNTVFENYTSYAGSITALGVFFYCIQIYCDFSGGIDIIRGIAQGLGIDMVENFKRPYFATSLGDFWRRWHISLGTWMKDYLFYGISLSKPFLKFAKKSRKTFKGRWGKIIPVSVTTFIVFFVIGIWHGANWKYIAFGTWNGVIISLSQVFEPHYDNVLKKLNINSKGFVWTTVQIIRTNFLVFIGRYFTRGATAMTALRMIKHTFISFEIKALLDNTIWSLGLTKFDFSLVIIGGFIIFIVGYLQESGIEIRKTLEKKNALIQWGVIMSGLIVLVAFGIYRDGYIATEFIYQQL